MYTIKKTMRMSSRWIITYSFHSLMMRSQRMQAKLRKNRDSISNIRASTSNKIHEGSELLHELVVFLCVKGLGEDISSVKRGFNVVNIKFLVQKAFSNIVVMDINMLRTLRDDGVLREVYDGCVV